VISPGDAQEHFVRRFADCEAKLAEASPGWLAPIRRAAIERFAELGFPTRKNEAWKYTNTAPISKAALDPSPATTNGVTRDAIRELVGSQAAECCLVFEDGRFAAELSSIDALPGDVEVRSLATAMAEDSGGLRSLLDAEDPLDRPFAALNRAFHRDGAFVRVTAGAAPERPIQLLFIATPGGAGRVANPRNIIRVDAGARAAITMRYAALGDGVYWTNAVTQVAVGPDAALDLVTIQTEAETAFHLSSLDVTQDRDSRFRSHLISLGSKLARSEINARLDAPGVDCELNGLFLVEGEQHVDSQTTIDHASPHGTSRELYKGILSGRSHGVFNGKILVRPGAQKTNAQQSNPNLLTSDHARINSKPTLEIEADDVKCTHGSTVGHLDADALFYLRARGIEERAARRMLTVAFASEIAQSIPQAALRAQVESEIARKLGQGRPGAEFA
jgi:Fe-S cluster assembly protein SufD